LEQSKNAGSSKIGGRVPALKANAFPMVAVPKTVLCIDELAINSVEHPEVGLVIVIKLQ